MGRLTKGQQNWLILSTATAALAIGGVLTRAPMARAADDAKGVQFFEAKVRPILAEHCVRCHGEEKHKGDLRLDTRENLLKGGKDDNDKPQKVVELGNPDKSLMIEAIGYKNEDIQMPPPKKKVSQKLTDEQISTLKEWVKMGAPYGAKPVEATTKE
ncbi:MAG TPA: c-type cytochrome domain-containing protein [Tepidisphaeraceae bacterium]|jgi:mono/diheme cytochrome c family protein